MGSSIDFSKYNPQVIRIPPYFVRRGAAPKVEYLFKLGEDHPIIARGCIQVLAGKPESGKSTFGLCLLAACACGKYGPLQTARGEPIKVLWVDTEQGRSLTTEKYEQLLGMAAIDGLSDKEISKRLKVLSLAEYAEPEQIKGIIKGVVTDMKPDFVFIDGVADLLEDFNSVTEARDLVRWLMNLAEQNKCAVMCMIHMNKGAKDNIGEKINGLQGVLGSKLAQKAQEIFIVERSGDLTTILHEKSRNKFGKIAPLYMTATKGENQEITLDINKPILEQMREHEKEEDRKYILISAIKKTEERGKNPNYSQLKASLEGEPFNYNGKRVTELINEGIDKKWIFVEKIGQRDFYRIMEEDNKQITDPEEEDL